jgi:hypothetical protein
MLMESFVQRLRIIITCALLVASNCPAGAKPYEGYNCESIIIVEVREHPKEEPVEPNESSSVVATTRPLEILKGPPMSREYYVIRYRTRRDSPAPDLAVGSRWICFVPQVFLKDGALNVATGRKWFLALDRKNLNRVLDYLYRYRYRNGRGDFSSAEREQDKNRMFARFEI